MKIKLALKKFKKYIREHLFNVKWRCNWCGEEIFSERWFCPECESKLPIIDKAYCNHCGRELKVSDEYCSTCKGKMISIDKGRSVFSYQEPIDKHIKDLKYFGKRYLVEMFGEYLSNVYFKNYFNADLIVFIPMTKKGKKERGFNQAELLARELSKRVGVPVGDVLEKTKQTTRQAKLGREERLKNLQGTIKVKDKKAVKDKVLLIVDDVTTTGATGEVVAERLKKSGAKEVYLLTVASVPPKEKY
ncbi:MAG: ComF family protein [Clostridia bacterium]|nr:ComF family protein [Clostridia bacterium]